jgi:hypothetical protein
VEAIVSGQSLLGYELSTILCSLCGLIMSPQLRGVQGQSTSISLSRAQPIDRQIVENFILLADVFQHARVRHARVHLL